MQFIAEIISSVTKKPLKFKDSFYSHDLTELWLWRAKFGEDRFLVIKVINDGKIECYENHPVSQLTPTKIYNLCINY